MVLAALVVVWLAGVAVMARVAGWHRLAAPFPAAAAVPEGERFRFLSGSMGSPHFPIRYRRCLHLVVAEQGFYLSLMFPFKFHSPAVFIPWSSVQEMREKQHFSNRSCTVLVCGHWPHITFAGQAGQVLLAVYRRARPHPDGGDDPVPG